VAASTGSSTTLLDSNSPLASGGKKSKNLDHWGNSLDPNDFALVDRTDHPSPWSAPTSWILPVPRHIPFDLSLPFASMMECCSRIAPGCCVVDDPCLASRRSGPSKTVLKYSDHILRWSVVDLVFICSSSTTSMNSASTWIPRS